MNEEEHKARHVELHLKLDELLADYITHGEGTLSHSILQLITWSHTQLLNPDHKEVG